MFKIEALAAKFGDALLIHFGKSTSDAHVAIVDGGPPGTYNDVLQQRIGQLIADNTSGGPLKIPLMMVSHIDYDHITGLLELTDWLMDLQNKKKSLPLEIDTFWHNSFESLVGSRPAGLSTEAATFVSAVLAGNDLASFGVNVADPDAKLAVVLASVPQGNRLSANIRGLKIKLNSGYGTTIGASGDSRNPTTVNIHNATFTVIAPLRNRLDDLKKEWGKAASVAELQAVLAEYKDESPANLSSIVALVDFDNKRLLLTGDARGDDILTGLGKAGLMSNGKFSLDVLKVPHHGSDRNITVDFFERLPAKKYLISADGKHGNPDLPTIRMIAKARGDVPVSLVFTYELPAVVKEVAALNSRGHNLKPIYRQSNQSSVSIDV